MKYPDGQEVKMFGLRACAFLCLVLFLSACDDVYDKNDFTKFEEERTALALGLTSYMTFKEVENALSLSENDYAIIEDSQSGRPENTPPFNILTIRIFSTDHEGIKGSADLHFFNNRLMETRLYPKNINELLDHYDSLKRQGEINLKPYTKVWHYKDLGGAEYIGFGDSRLRNQLLAWIAKYA